MIEIKMCLHFSKRVGLIFAHLICVHSNISSLSGVVSSEGQCKAIFVSTIESVYTVLRRSVLALSSNKAEQSHAVLHVLRILLALHANSVADDCSSSKAAKHSFVVGVAVNVLAHLHKDSAAQWGSAAFTSVSTSAATKNSVDAEGRSLSQQCLQLALTGVSLPSQGNTSAASFICTAPSLAAFGPAQLLAVLLNKVGNIVSASLLQSCE
jgi:hypothetical protein